MQVNFKKSITSFDGTVNVFHFNRIFSASGFMYHVSVKRFYHISHYFLMEQKDDTWFFTDATVLAQWIIELEPKLAVAILENV
jgi:hypothetical protein